MVQIENQPLMDENVNEVRISPSITANIQNKDFITLKIELNLVIDSNQSKHVLNVGEALLHVVNQEWITDSLINHVRYKANHAAITERVYAKNLQYALENLAQSNIKFDGSIAFMHRFEIDEQHRGNGYTKAFLWLLLKLLQQEGIHIVLLHAYPLRCEGMNRKNIQQEQRRLERIYLKSGFHNLKSKKPLFISNEGLPVRYMYCHLKTRTFSEFE